MSSTIFYFNRIKWVCALWASCLPGNRKFPQSSWSHILTPQQELRIDHGGKSSKFFSHETDLFNICSSGDLRNLQKMNRKKATNAAIPVWIPISPTQRNALGIALTHHRTSTAEPWFKWTYAVKSSGFTATCSLTGKRITKRECSSHSHLWPI